MVRCTFSDVWLPILQCDKLKRQLFKRSSFKVPRNWFLPIKSLTTFTIKLFKHKGREKNKEIEKVKRHYKFFLKFHILYPTY